jgi:hypothetical protein
LETELHNSLTSPVGAEAGVYGVHGVLSGIRFLEENKDPTSKKRRRYNQTKNKQGECRAFILFAQTNA